ncbi:MAG: hypothetical protein LBS18_04980, partial [Clostridiales bacterium]|nr:hypothetical protein [Clostridiales bacterium]
AALKSHFILDVLLRSISLSNEYRMAGIPHQHMLTRVYLFGRRPSIKKANRPIPNVVDWIGYDMMGLYRHADRVNKNTYPRTRGGAKPRKVRAVSINVFNAYPHGPVLWVFSVRRTFV